MKTVALFSLLLGLLISTFSEGHGEVTDTSDQRNIVDKLKACGHDAIPHLFKIDSPAWHEISLRLPVNRLATLTNEKLKREALKLRLVGSMLTRATHEASNGMCRFTSTVDMNMSLLLTLLHSSPSSKCELVVCLTDFSEVAKLPMSNTDVHAAYSKLRLADSRFDAVMRRDFPRLALQRSMYEAFMAIYEKNRYAQALKQSLGLELLPSEIAEFQSWWSDRLQSVLAENTAPESISTVQSPQCSAGIRQSPIRKLQLPDKRWGYKSIVLISNPWRDSSNELFKNWRISKLCRSENGASGSPRAQCVYERIRGADAWVAIVIPDHTDNETAEILKIAKWISSAQPTNCKIDGLISTIFVVNFTE
jgi:hypothetical protein